MCGNCNKLPRNVNNLSLNVYAGLNMVESPSISGISRATATDNESTHSCNTALQITYTDMHT